MRPKETKSPCISLRHLNEVMALPADLMESALYNLFKRYDLFDDQDYIQFNCVIVTCQMTPFKHFIYHGMRNGFIGHKTNRPITPSNHSSFKQVMLDYISQNAVVGSEICLPIMSYFDSLARNQTNTGGHHFIPIKNVWHAYKAKREISIKQEQPQKIVVIGPEVIEKTTGPDLINLLINYERSLRHHDVIELNTAKYNEFDIATIKGADQILIHGVSNIKNTNHLADVIRQYWSKITIVCVEPPQTLRQLRGDLLNLNSDRKPLRIILVSDEQTQFAKRFSARKTFMLLAKQSLYGSR